MTDNAPLAVFRMLFGLLMLVECWGAIATGWVGDTFVTPLWTFPMMGLESLRVLSGPWMYGYFGLMGVFASGVALGYRYRASAALLALMWTGAYLAQKSHYNNHYYLASLIAWWMAVVPAHRRASLDVRRGAVEATDEVDALVPRVFRWHLGIVFVYAAIAKLYPGWLNGDYLRVNLGSKGDRWPLGSLVVEPWFQTATIYGAIAFDALVIPALAWRRTRMLAFLGLIAFNLFNSIVFRIGIFPYMVLAFTVFFFEPSTVRRIFRRALEPASAAPHAAKRFPAAVRLAAGAYFAVQLALPLRHHLIPGDVTRTEEGHRMSWRMMLRAKSGYLTLVAVDRGTGESWPIDASEYLSPRQQMRAAVQPEFTLQFARLVAANFAERGYEDIAIFARASAMSVNGGPAAPLIDPNVDLARAEWNHFGHDAWVLDAAASGAR